MPLTLAITLVVFLSLGAVGTVAMIGKKRAPITPLVAAVNCVINIALIVSIVIWGV